MKSFLGTSLRIWAAIRARRTLWMALGALGFGALAVVGARNYIAERLDQEKARLQPRHDMVELVVAKRDLRRGEVVGSETMAVRALPRDYAPGGALTPSRFDSVIGARLLLPMRAGEPLMPTALAGADTGAISGRLRPGVRAMTIAVDEVNSLSGMLQPGDRIDLMLSVRPPPGAGGFVQPEFTRTVMQGVPVMATGRQSRAGSIDDASTGRPYTSITVEVNPDQAQQLVVAQRSGKLTAVLRNPGDRTAVADRRLDVNMLLGLPAPVAPMPVRPGPEVIVGGRGAVPASAGAAPGPAMAAASAPAVLSSGSRAPSPAIGGPGTAAPFPPGARGVPLPEPGSVPSLEPPVAVPLFR